MGLAFSGCCLVCLTWHGCGLLPLGLGTLVPVACFGGLLFLLPPSFPSSHLLGVTAGALQATCALGSCGVPPTHRLSAVKSGRICAANSEAELFITFPALEPLCPLPEDLEIWG